MHTDLSFFLCPHTHTHAAPQTQYLRRKVLKYREQCLQFKAETEAQKRECEALRAENQRAKDAHAAAGLSFSSLNQHAANLQRVNKRLQREHAAAVEEARRLEQAGVREVGRVREEAARHAERLDGQLRRAREELKGKHELFQLEVQMRLKQDRMMGDMVALVQRRVGGQDPELVEELVEMRHACSVGVLEDVASRSSLIGGPSSMAGGAGGVGDGGSMGAVGASVKAGATKMLSGFVKFLGAAGDNAGL